MPYIRFLMLCLIWGSSFILMKRAGAGFSFWAIAAGRVFIGWIVLVIVSFWKSKAGPSRTGQTLTAGWKLQRSHFTAVVGVTLLGYALPYAVQPLFIQRTGSSSLAAMGVGFTPLLTLILSVPLLSVRPTRKQLVGVLGALVCLGVLLVDTIQRSITAFDVTLLFATPLMYALANIWLRSSLSDIPPLELTIVCLALSGILLSPLACYSPGPMSWTSLEIGPAVICLAILGIFGTGLGMLVFNQMVQQQGPLFAAMVTNLTPIGAVLLGWADAERVTLLQVFALLGVLLCVATVQWGAADASLPRNAPQKTS